MHLIATYFPVFIDCAFSTSEKVPSPFFEINRYSTVKRKELIERKMPTVHLINIIIIFKGFDCELWPFVFKLTVKRFLFCEFLFKLLMRR